MAQINSIEPIRKSIPCAYCGSPVIGNPCWWEIKYPGAAARGGDPPCEDYFYNATADANRLRHIAFTFKLVAIGMVVGVLLLAWLWWRS